MMTHLVGADPGAQTACVRLAEPPRASDLCVLMHLVKTAPLPGPGSNLAQQVVGEVCAASGDGLLFLLYSDLRVVKPGAREHWAEALARRRIGRYDLTRFPDITRFVLNPLTRQLYRLPDIACCDPATKLVYGGYMGLLTQADRGHGPPDRFAIAVPEEGNLNVMLRFLSDKDEWENVEVVSPCQLPSARQMVINQGTLAYGGKPWLPLKEGRTPQIGPLDPLNASVMYLTIDQHVIVLDMNKKEVIGPCLYTGTSNSIPCVLPPWLGSSRIPSAGFSKLTDAAF